MTRSSPLTMLYRALREERGFTQRSLAMKIERDPSLISQAEAGLRPFSPDLRNRLDEVLARGKRGSVRYVVVRVDDLGGQHGLLDDATASALAFASRETADAAADLLCILGYAAAPMPVREAWEHGAMIIDEGPANDALQRTIAFLRRFEASMPAETER